MRLNTQINCLNVNQIINLPSPNLSGDAVNKDYADIPLNMYKREYIMPDATSISTSSIVISPMIGFTATATNTAATYTIYANLRLSTSVANRIAIIWLYVNGVQSDIRYCALPLAATEYSFDLEWFRTVPINQVIDLRWQLNSAGATITCSSGGGAFSAFSVLGIRDSLFTL